MGTYACDTARFVRRGGLLRCHGTGDFLSCTLGGERTARTGKERKGRLSKPVILIRLIGLENIETTISYLQGEAFSILVFIIRKRYWLMKHLLYDNDRVLV